MTIQERIDAIHAGMQAACDRSGRSIADVQLIAVSKTYSAQYIRGAMDCGQTLFGESRIQEAEAKIGMLPSQAQWHLIGHLQTNKAKKAVRLFSVIHSVDSLHLLQEIEKCAAQAGRTIGIFIEVNISGEASKHGVVPEAAADLVLQANDMLHLDIKGLMTVPPWSDDRDKIRPHFHNLRLLRDEIVAQTSIPLPDLSMGMSHDYDLAIEEGATYIRVGTAIFGERHAPEK